MGGGHGKDNPAGILHAQTPIHLLYPRQYVQWVRALMRLGLWWRTQQAHQRFAGGAITGVQLAEELAAYSLLKRL